MKYVNKIIIWNTQDYSSREAAEADKATSEHTISDAVPVDKVDDFINAYVWGLIDAGSKLLSDVNALAYEVVQKQIHIVEVEVLEWNTYHFEVNANSEAEAQQIALAEGVSLPHVDVEYGTSNYFSEEKTDDRLVTK